MLSKTFATGITLLSVACGCAADTANAETSETPAAARILLAQAPDPFEQAFWDTVKNSNNPADYEAYLEAFPDGQFVPLARARVITLRGEAAPEIEEPPAPEDTAAAYEVLRRANLRQSPKGSGKRVARLRPGTTVVVTGEAEGGRWLQVTLQDGRNGYVIAEVLRKKPDPEVVLPTTPTPDAAEAAPATQDGDSPTVSVTVGRDGRLRVSPTATSRRIARVRKGDRVAVRGKDASGKWYQVQNEKGEVGYLHRSIIGSEDLPVATVDEAGRAEALDTPPAAPVEVSPAPTPVPLAPAPETVARPVVPPPSPPAKESAPEPPPPAKQKIAVIPEPAKSPQPAAPSVAPEAPTVAPEPPAPAPRVDELSFRDCSLCPEMVPLGAGRFVMGSNSGDSSERPVHTVTLSRDFAMGRYEVTIAEWQACVQAGGCQPVGEAQDGVPDNTPVNNVSWRDAHDFARWLAQTTGKPYRLPTEAEWEYATRAGTRSRFWWGNELGDGRANCRDCGGPWDRRKPAAAGSYAANPFDLHDTSGGVWEWVSDCWHDSYSRAPTDGSSWEKADCRVRVLRGGSWRNDSSYVHSSSRFKYDAEVRYKANGFRVAMDLE